MSEDHTKLLTENGRFVAAFSKSFQEKLDQCLAAGYRFKEAKVDYVVYWWDKEEGKEWRVVLGEVALSR